MYKCEQEYLCRSGFSQDAEICGNGKHFHWHYVIDFRDPGYCVPIYKGHCAYPRLKDRKIDDVCERFEKE